MNINRVDNLLHVAANKRIQFLPRWAGIYAIKADGIINYVGSAENVYSRCTSHLSKIEREYDDWIVPQLKGKDIEFVLLEDCRYLKKDQRYELEYSLIIEYRTYKPFGLNTVNPITKKVIVMSDNIEWREEDRKRRREAVLEGRRKWKDQCAKFKRRSKAVKRQLSENE